MENEREIGAYIVAGSKPWNKRIFDEIIIKYPGQWYFVGTKEQMTLASLQKLVPRYLFFIHWSWKIPDNIVENYECIGFHMTDVPYGRGGSPLQNLIVRGHKRTKLSAIRITHNFDEGPVYIKEDLSLEGNAEEILMRASLLSAEMISRIIQEKIKPILQSGKPTIFRRRRPEDSEIQEGESLEKLYNFIRMLDAEGYPKAFFVYKGFRYEISRAAFYNGRIEADIKITASKDMNI